MAAQQGTSERSHIIFSSPVGSSESPVRLQHRRQSAAVDGDDDDDETIRTEGFQGADDTLRPFADTSPIRRNRQQAGDQMDEGQPPGDQVQQPYGPWQDGYSSYGQTGNHLDYEFEKSVARSAVQLVDLPSAIYDMIQSNCVQGFNLMRNALMNTDNRLWTKNFLKDMPVGFFTPYEVQAFLASPPGDSWQAIKKACMLRYKSADAPATARNDLLKVNLDLKAGVVPYLIELRQQAIISASVTGNDVQPSTVIRKMLADMPNEIASRMLEATDESTRWLNAASCDFRDLHWFDTLSSEIITVHDTLKSAGVKLSPRTGQTYMLNALQSDGSDFPDAINGPAINAAAVRTFEAAVAAGFSNKDPRLSALAKAAGWRGPSGTQKKRPADDGKGKKKDRKERRKDGDDKFTGDTDALIADCKKAYTDAEWKERLALIQAGKALNVDDDPHKDLFVNDKAKDKHGKKRWVCVKCLRFGHTAPFCDDLKRATSWKQGK